MSLKTYLTGLIGSKKPKVEWWSTVPGLTELEPVQPANKFFPEWFKKMPRWVEEGNPFDKGTFKNCPGIVDFYKDAFVIPLWADFYLNVSEKDFGWKCSNEDFTMSLHYKEQFLDHTPKNVKKDVMVVAKTDCPWRVKTSKGWGMLQLPMFYDFNEDFECLPGLTYTEWSHQINQQLLLKKKGEFLLKKGTPIAMYKPVKLDKINYTVKDEDDEKFIESYKSNLKFQSKFKGSYNSIKGKYLSE